MMTGDAEDRLRDLADCSVHAIITSPPYYGLRNYSESAQIGHEDTPKAYVERLVAVFREARRALRDDGSLWVVIGDCYAANRSYQVSDSKYTAHDFAGSNAMRVPNRMKPKDLIGIPWMLAFALRDDGWYLREEIIWQKLSCMPESTKDRCTRQHETIFHLTKRQIYYHDWFAIAEPAAGMNEHDLTGQSYDAPGQATQTGSREKEAASTIKNARSVWTINPEPFDSQMCTACGTYYRGTDYKRLVKDEKNRRTCTCGANDAWLSHFATYPSRLVSRILRCSTPDGGCCPHCETPLARIVEKGEPDEDWKRASGADASGGYAGASRDGAADGGAQDASATKARILAGMTTKRTAGWKRTCGCPDGEPIPAVVLDPFSGAVTTLLSAARMGRHGIGIDLKRKYHIMSERRLRDPLAKCLDGDGSRLPFTEPKVSMA